MMNIHMFISIIVAVFSAFLAVKWIYFKILFIAFDKKLVDNPDARKLQKTPVPVMGGFAAFFGILVGIFSSLISYGITSYISISSLLPLVCAMSIMLYVGAMDDIMGLTPKARILIEIFAICGIILSSDTCINNFWGLWGVYEFSLWIAIPLTVFAGVGIINAINMIDGVNGLSSGLCIVYCLFFGVAFLKEGDLSNATLAFTTVGALMPFYIHNVFGFKSRMFIGDAGTMVIGLLLTWFTINLINSNTAALYLSNTHNVNVIALTLAVLSVPVFDTLRVMAMRIAKKKSPFHPDKTHLHHVFVNVGVSHFITSVSEICIDVVVVLFWVASVVLNCSIEAQLYVVILASMIFVWGTYFILRYNAIHHTKFLHFITAFSVKTHLGRKDWWKKITDFLDAPGWSMYDVSYSSKKRVEIGSTKELDRKRVLDFMSGRAEVMVQDILDNSGANKENVIRILLDEIDNGVIEVTRRSELGIPDIVAFVNKPSN